MARQDFINAEELVNRLNEAFNKHKTIIDANAESLKKLQTEYTKVPSDYLKAQREIQQTLLTQGKAEQQLIKVKQQKEKLSQDEIRTTQSQLRLERQKATYKEQDLKRMDRERQKLEFANSLYNKVQQKLNSLQKEYRDLAVQKELTGKLTDAEAKRYDFLSTRITKYDKVLKGVDASMGKYQRNVGNYASAFNPLQNSINQLTREAPAFANSIQTGFMAISNNLPIFFDSMKQIIAQNKELQLQGKETTSVIKQLGAGIFSWGTALSLGVTLLTFYGAELAELAKKAFSSSKALDTVAESQKNITEIAKEASKSITQERIELERNLSIAKDTTLSYKDREIAADKVLKQYPYWFENLGKERIMNGQVEQAIKGVTDALLARAKATAAETKITENQSKIIDLEEKLRDVVADRQKQESTYNELLEIQRAGNLKNANSILIADRAIKSGKKEEADIQKEINELNDINNRLTSYAITNAKEAIGLDYQKEESTKSKDKAVFVGEANSRAAFEKTISTLTYKLSLISKENALYGTLETTLNLATAAYEAMYGEQDKNNKETEKTLKYGTIAYYNDLISRLESERDAVAESNREYSLYTLAIDEYKAKIDEITGKTKDVKELNDELQKFFKGFTSGFLSDVGLSSLETFFDGTFSKLIEGADTVQEKFAATFLAVTEVAQEAFSFLTQNSQAYFDAQLQYAEREKDIALEFAGENAAGREEIERQFEERQREIRNREAKAQKQQALFNIAINTAQGIVAALASTPPNVPLSVTIGIIGAAQAALVAARQVPQYMEGTDYHPGGAMIVNDAPGGNYREVVEMPDGRIVKPQGRNVLMDAPKGTKVHKSYKDFEGELSKHLQDIGIAPMADVMLRDAFAGYVNIQQSTGITKQDLKSALNETLGKMPKITNVYDKNGFRQWIGSESARQESLNSTLHNKGIDL